MRLTRRQYRRFAEQTKAVGLALNLSTYQRMKRSWGTYSPWALSICRDATEEEPEYAEHALITLAATVNTDAFRACAGGRPEMDWSALADKEIYPFIVQHEIGHRMNNFDALDIMMLGDLAVRDKCHGHVRFVNELLADRYAWAQIRPGEPMPLNARGRRMRDEGCPALEYLDQHAPKRQPFKNEWRLRPGAYNDVPDYMLASPERAAFIGSRVNKRLQERKAAYYSKLTRDMPNHPLF